MTHKEVTTYYINMGLLSSLQFAVLGHLMYISVHHIHYKLCLGGLTPWSYIYGVNAYSNFICSETLRWNEQLGGTLKGLLFGALVQCLNDVRNVMRRTPLEAGSTGTQTSHESGSTGTQTSSESGSTGTQTSRESVNCYDSSESSSDSVTQTSYSVVSQSVDSAASVTDPL